MAMEYITATEAHADGIHRVLQTTIRSVYPKCYPAATLYEHRGYRATGHGIIDLENDAKLVFEKMEKSLR